jgi:hypothetical protein
MSARGLGQCPAGHSVPETIALAAKGALRCFMCRMMGEPQDDEPVDLYRFNHINQDGNLYRHTDEQLICKAHINPIIDASIDRGNANCFINQPDGCGGSIHFCELPMMLQENRAIFDRYRAVCDRIDFAGGKRRYAKSTRRNKRKATYRKRKHSVKHRRNKKLSRRR